MPFPCRVTELTPFHSILVPAGTPGDVQPFVDIGLELQRRGHRVTLLANDHFRARADHNGFSFVSTGSREQYHRLLDDPNLWHPLKQHRVFARKLICRELRPSFDEICRMARRETCVVVQQSMALGARVARDAIGVPTVTLHRQPIFLRSMFDSGSAPFMLLGRRVPRPIKLAQFKLIDELVDRPFLPELNSLRTDVGLEPVRRWSRDWLNSPDLVIGLWSNWYAQPQSDWPGKVVLAGFIGSESAEGAQPPALREFLDSGDKPIVFTLGSGMRFGADVFKLAIEISRRLHRRAVIATRATDSVPGKLPADAIHVCYAPFSSLLPRCAAIVHHGGIGTVAQSLAAGIPQLVLPGLVFDNWDSADRLRRLGVARAIPIRRFSTDRAVRALTSLLSDVEIARRCRLLARRLHRRDACSIACDAIEQLAQQTYSGRCSSASLA